jgi:hypothetical protein
MVSFGLEKHWESKCYSLRPVKTGVLEFKNCPMKRVVLDLGPHQYRQAFTPLLSIWPHPSAPRLGHSKTLEQQRRIAGLQLDGRADTDGGGTGA